MKFKDFVNTKTEQEMELEGNSILLHIILKLSEEFADDNIRYDFKELIKKHIKLIGDTQIIKEKAGEEK